jgi:hypothetical protein
MDRPNHLIDRPVDAGSARQDGNQQSVALNLRLTLRERTLAEVPAAAGIADGYLSLAEHGLRSMYDATARRYPQTARGTSGALTMEGVSVRYTAIAALGVARLDPRQQRDVLSGALAVDLVGSVMDSALAGSDPGAVALATWLAAELGSDDIAATGVQKIKNLVRAGTAIPTVDQAWMLTALVEHGLAGPADPIAAELVDRLLRHQDQGGIFPHVLPPAAQHRLRAHVGCFADQVYPIQALARYSTATGDARALAAANLCADRICELQGPAGQWWWHYDARNSEVVEGFPVYSVHQHAMAPMALFDLYEAGGHNHLDAVVRGLDWIETHPELPACLISADLGVIWRKIGRREPAKAMRKLRSVTTALRPGLRLGLLDRVFPPTRIDQECRPYELGWLLYAWARPSADLDASPAGIS